MFALYSTDHYILGKMAKLVQFHLQKCLSESKKQLKLSFIFIFYNKKWQNSSTAVFYFSIIK